MFRFLLIVLVATGIGLALTNPTPDEIRAKLDSQLISQLGASAGAVTQDPVGQTVTTLLGDKVQSQVLLERRNYYLLSLYRVSIGGRELPGCIIGIANQALPYSSC